MTEEMQGCEHCQKEFSLETMRMMSDAWFCEACTADWQKHFDACDHQWSPYTDEMGDDGRICEKCSGFVRYDCQTCRDDPMVCASIPSLRHCEKAMRESTSQAHS